MKTIRIMILSLGWILTAHSQSERSLIRDGNSAYKQGKFTDAEVKKLFLELTINSEKDIREIVELIARNRPKLLAKFNKMIKK